MEASPQRPEVKVSGGAELTAVCGESTAAGCLEPFRAKRRIITVVIAYSILM